MERQPMSDVWILLLCFIFANHHFCCCNSQENNRSCTSPCDQCNFASVCDPPQPATCIRENIALGKQASMSSEFPSLTTFPDANTGKAACLAFDGYRNTHYTGSTTYTSPDCIHTKNSNEEWLQVDLGRNYTIKNITVYRRDNDDEIQRLANILITVDNQQCYQFPANVAGFPRENNVRCTTPLTGRIVRLSTRNEYLNLCEIEIWVCKSGRYGELCDGECHCRNNTICDNYYGTCLSGCDVGYYGFNCSQQCGHCSDQSQCDASGYCLTGCQPGWQGPKCDYQLCTSPCKQCNFDSVCNPPPPDTCIRENIALGKQASMSSEFAIQTTFPDAHTTEAACLAFDGYRNTHYTQSTSYTSPNCIHTMNNNEEWLQVDLGTNYTITNITVYRRDNDNEIQRLANILITVDSQQCYQFPSNVAGYPTENKVRCTTPLTGRIVKLSTRNQYLNLCEIEIWVCKSGRYGELCDGVCHCRNNTICDNFYGTCLSGCDVGYYGLNCSQQCGHCSDQSQCNDSGHCLTGCQVGWQEPNCDFCENGFFGPQCSKCGNCRDLQPCNSTTGICSNGCADGYAPPLCNETCTNNKYGPNCSLSCGQCKSAVACNIIDGSCIECETNFLPPLCIVCQSGFFGPQCIKCGKCNNSQPCNSTTGVCSNGCEDGYETPMCNETCKNKTFGSACSKPCGRCKNATSCDVINGSCAECEMNFLLPICKECNGGYYGVNCNETCGKCRNSTCRATDGVCVDGCQNGYEKPFCNDTCRNNTFGQNCGLECGQCINSTQCDVFNGSCTACESNFNLSMCTECITGYYGTNCNIECGHCKDAQICNNSDGVCPNGCEDGYVFPLCNQRSTTSGDNTGLIVGIVFGVILAVIILVGIIFFMRRQGYFKSSEDRISRPDGSTNSFAPLSTESTDNKSTVKPKVAVKPRVRESSSPVYENFVLGDSSSLDTKKQYQMDDVPSNCDMDVQEYDIVLENSEELYGNDEVIYAALKSNTNMDHIQRYLVDRLTSGALLQEFKHLKKDIRKPHQTALLPPNIKKNRFKVIVPYDCNRVTLTDGYEEGDATDYINASFVKGIRSDSQYIAAQGPRDNTVTDFWRMILQERVTDIVMVTNLQEGGKNKCYEYWPAKDTTQTYGPVKVTGLDVQSRAYYFTRTFSLSGADGGEHKVTQYHFTAWPDHGVPTVTALVDFWRFVKSRINACGLSDPLLVHCSAGVGRTGTYIGLDIGMDECLLNGKINLAAIVDRMRDDRTTMVQAPEQYVFLYKALLEVYTGRETKLSVHQFEAVISQSVNSYTPNERIDKEFQIVMQMRSITAEQCHSIAIADENKSKNRNESILPSDDHIVYLTEHVPKRNQYINAVYMSTFRKSKGTILTQLPLSDTLIDFWRLIFGNEVTTVVSLGGTHDETNIENFCRYWPLTEDGIQIGPYSVTLQASSRLGKHLTMYTLTLSKQNVAKSLEIQLLRYEGWSSEIPDKTDLYQLVEILDTNTTVRPIVIQCTDGGTKSGLFCCIRDIISRVTFDHEVDVYMTVRKVQSVRPEAVTKVEQYRFCYEVAQEKVREQNVYANT